MEIVSFVERIVGNVMAKGNGLRFKNRYLFLLYFFIEWLRYPARLLHARSFGSISSTRTSDPSPSNYSSSSPCYSSSTLHSSTNTYSLPTPTHSANKPINRQPLSSSSRPLSPPSSSSWSTPFYVLPFSSLPSSSATIRTPPSSHPFVSITLYHTCSTHVSWYISSMGSTLRSRASCCCLIYTW